MKSAAAAQTVNYQETCLPRDFFELTLPGLVFIIREKFRQIAVLEVRYPGDRLAVGEDIAVNRVVEINKRKQLLQGLAVNTG